MASSEERGSKRPDGTYRKVIRVREGYTPPDEVAVYTAPNVRAAALADAASAASAAASVRKPAIPGLSPVLALPAISSKKPSGPIVVAMKEEVSVSKTSRAAAPTTSAMDVAPTEEDIAKKVKQLKKKIRQILEIKGKVDSGEVTESDLNADQKEKLSKLEDIESEIARLTVS